MSHPFIMWTMRRAGGTPLTELLMEMSEHKKADHEPFNFRYRAPRQFGKVTQAWDETRDDAALSESLAAIFAERFLIKHCYELHDMQFNSRLMKAATKANYRQILLRREDE